MQFIPSLKCSPNKFRSKIVILLAILVLLLLSLPLATREVRESIEEEEIAPRKFEECTTARKHILLLKTHKCASSAVQNLLLRYGYQNNLTFALPHRGNYLGHPKKFQVKTIDPNLLPPSGKVDIFCLHSRLDKVEMKKVLHPDTVWVTVVREPTKLFESLFTFFKLRRQYHVALDAFGTKIGIESLRKVSRTNGMKFGKNQMLFDLGGEENFNLEEVSAFTKYIDRLFDLVIITERMEESLVLLRHKMCWDMEDIMIFQRNARAEDRKVRIGPLANETIRHLNAADALIYNHFLARHQDEVYKFGKERMQKEVFELKALTNEYYDYCVQTEVLGHDSRLEFQEYSALVGSYLLNKNTKKICQLLTMPELTLIDLIRKKQEQDLNRKS